MKYIVVQRAGFVSYFLSAWRDGGASCTCGWDRLRVRAIVFEGPAARRIADRLNCAATPRPLPVTVEVIQ